MDDAGGVGLGDCVACLKNKRNGGVGRHGPALLEDPSEVVAVQELHDHVRGARVELAHVDHAGDVITLEPHGGTSFTKKSLDRVLVAKGVLPYELDGHELVELLVSRRHHDAHPSNAEDPLDTVFSGEQIALPDGGHSQILNTSRARSRI